MYWSIKGAQRQSKGWGMTQLKSGQRMRTVVVLTAIGFAIACTPIIRNHGFMPAEDDLAVITVGVDTRESVRTLVGPPTAGGVLDGSGYYYVASTFRHFGAFAPQETSRQVLAIRFDDAGTVRNIERFGLEDGNVVVLSRRVTDSNVSDNTLIRQVLGNLGQVDAGTFIGEN